MVAQPSKPGTDEVFPNSPGTFRNRRQPWAASGGALPFATGNGEDSPSVNPANKGEKYSFPSTLDL
jgi:hypothetical protein